MALESVRLLVQFNAEEATEINGFKQGEGEGRRISL
jgi:hypothetical protein